MDAIQVGVACPCPSTPHPDGDTVGLRPKLGLRAGTAVQKLVIDAYQAAGMASADLIGLLAEAYLLEGVVEWTFVDAIGKPIPVTPDTIRSQLLDDFAIGSPVAEAADALYLGPVILPLARKASSSSPPSPTNGSTSASNGHTPRPRKRSRPSSTSTSLTGVTATTTTSPVGDSNSSQNST